jgi:hypothetical protein
LLGGRTKKQEADSVAGNQKDEGSLGESRRPGRLLSSNKPDPKEGVRLIKAFLAIEDHSMREALIRVAEAISQRKV